MEFVWVWLFGLKTPLSVLCGLAIFGCFVNFLSVRSSGRGSDNLWNTLHIAIGIAVVWAGIYAIPEPDYNVKTVIVYKDRVVEKPVVKKVVAVTRTITRTITQKYTQDSRFNWCIDQRTSNMWECMKFAKAYMEPRIVIKQVPVKVYSGVQIKTVMYTRDARVRWCYQQSGTTLDQCLAFAFKMESPPQVRVRVEHDPYQDLFDKCNATGQILTMDPNHVALRNERIKMCGELALRASHDH